MLDAAYDLCTALPGSYGFAKLYQSLCGFDVFILLRVLQGFKKGVV